MIASTKEAHKRRCVATIDIPGSYLHTESDEYVIIILKVRLAELLVNIDPKICRKDGVMDREVKVI